VLEYMRQIDHGEYMDSLTYIVVCHYNSSNFGNEEHKEFYVYDRDGHV
jgi:hypothetical protein